MKPFKEIVFRFNTNFGSYEIEQTLHFKARCFIVSFKPAYINVKPHTWRLNNLDNAHDQITIHNASLISCAAYLDQRGFELH